MRSHMLIGRLFDCPAEPGTVANSANTQRDLWRAEHASSPVCTPIPRDGDVEMMVFRYWAEPASAHDAAMLMRQLARAAAYRRELIEIENRARALTRAILSLPKDQRAPYYDMVRRGQHAASKWARDRARADRPIPIVSEDGPVGFSADGTGWEIGCSWGSCSMVADAQDQSQRTTTIGKDLPTFVPRDEGVLAVQYQQHKSDPKWRSTSAASLIGGQGTLCRIGGDLCGKIRRSGLEGAKRLRTVMFRIGSDGKRPIWANLYTLIHRPLPDARVVWVRLVCRRVGLRHRWHLIIVVDHECRGRADDVRGSAVGVDIGWRKMPDGGIRVAYWHGTDGREGELVIPDEVTRRKSKSDSLQAIRDRERNEVAALWRAWIFGDSISAAPSSGADHGGGSDSTSAVPSMGADLDTGGISAAPSMGADLITRAVHLVGIPLDHPVRVAAQSMHQWLRIGRYVTLARLWSSNRIPGDEDIYARVHTWLAHDRHLYAWQINNLRRMHLQVEGRIQDLAVQLARKYELVAVEARGMVPELVKRDDSMDDDERRLRHLNASRVGVVAPAFVRAQLERFAKKYGALYREVDPANTTRRCGSCGVIREVRDPAQRVLQCDECGAKEDQDRTASRSIERVASAQVREEVAAALAPASTSGSARKMGARRTRKARPDGPLDNRPANIENLGQ